MVCERDGERNQVADQGGGDDGGCGLAHGSSCAAIVAEALTGKSAFIEPRGHRATVAI